MSLEHTSLETLRKLAYAKMRLPRAQERDRLEGSLIDFVRAAWPWIDSSEYQDSWAIEALCRHLQAVTEGRIDRLLINLPPRCGKTLVTSVCWPVWAWIRRQRNFRSGPQVRFLCGSYNHTLSLENSNRSRRLITSRWFQERWGSRFKLRQDQNTKSQFDNSEGGSRLATSVGGSLLGLGGDIIVIDDPANTEEVESDAQRETTLQWWREIRSTRLNDPKQSAIVVNMQRLHEDDVSGAILREDEDGEWVHLMLPMRHDKARHCITIPLSDDEEAWEDPRSEDGELLWDERFGERQVAALERDLGPYMASGRLQQSPAPKGGGIFKREWWNLWESTDGKFPLFDYLVASLDSAFTEKEENDPSGFTIWGVWKDADDGVVPDKRSGQLWHRTSFGRQKVMLVHAWRKHLEMHGAQVDRLQDETEVAYIRRAQPHWGLVEWVAYTCRRFKVDRLLIEAKASGITAAQEMQRLYGNETWTTQLEQVVGDKVARAHAVVPAWSQGLIFAPDRDWADLVIEEMSSFPKGRHDDLTDSSTMAIRHLRQLGLIQHEHEREAEDHERSKLRKKQTALYPV